MPDISWFGWSAMAAGALLIGISKTGFPGAGILSVLLMAAAVPAKASTGLILPLLILGDIFAVAYYRRHAVWSHLLRLIPCAAAGVVLGYLAMGKVNDDQLRRIIGGAILGMLTLSWLRNRRPQADMHVPIAWWFPVVIGLLAGVTTMMCNAAGPIMVIYLLAMRLPKDAFIGTGAWYYLLLNSFKVPFSANLGLIAGQSLSVNLALAPLVVIGALAGVRLVKLVPEKAFTTIVQVLAAGAAVLLLLPRLR